MDELDKERINIVRYIDQFCDEKAAVYLQKEFIKQKNKIRYGKRRT